MFTLGGQAMTYVMAIGINTTTE